MTPRATADADVDRRTTTRRADYAPVGTDRRTGLFATVKRTFTEFKEDNLSDWAAALTYYGLLSLFPALIALVSIVSLVGDPASTTRTLTDIVTRIGPASAADTFAGPIRSLTAHRSAAGILFVVGLATALWSASGYIGAFMRAANAVYGTEETRAFWKLRPLQLAVTAVMVVLLAFLAIGFVISGSVARSLGDTIGLGDSAVTVWNIAKWPVMLLVAVVMIALLTWVGPDVRQPRFRWITPGAAIGLLILILASVGFAFYTANLGSYNATYGALGGVIVFLVWLWIANLALLFGVELDAQLERQRKVEADAA